jgi:hypothetical protein
MEDKRMSALRSVKTTPWTAQDLLRERGAEWRRFTQFTAYGVAGVVALLLLMRIFLV